MPTYQQFVVLMERLGSDATIEDAKAFYKYCFDHGWTYEEILAISEHLFFDVVALWRKL
jgi:hypothetical protein